jgi:hypothetical protein
MEPGLDSAACREITFCSLEGTMRSLILNSILLSAAFVGGCGVDTIHAPLPSALTPIVERAQSASEKTFSYTSIDVPGAVFTGGSGINPHGDIVGTYRDAAGRSHGYVFRDGEFTRIDFPGSVFTEAKGINPGGEIVGDYRMAGEPGVNFHGYRRTADGDFVAVNYPGHTSFIVQRILPDGTMLGCRHDGDLMDTMKGVTVSSQGNAEIDEFASMNNGATPDHRQIVGLYVNMAGSQQGFLIRDGVLEPLFVGAVPATAAWDMNPAGEIVGVFNRAGVHGYVLRGEDYVQIDFPGATATRVFGINPRGDIVGTYVSADGKSHGFVARR